MIHVNRLADKNKIQCDLDAFVLQINVTEESYQHCPVVTIVDKNDEQQCLYLWGVLDSFSECIANQNYSG